jgi:hypothetical protein
MRGKGCGDGKIERYTLANLESEHDTVPAIYQNALSPYADLHKRCNKGSGSPTITGRSLRSASCDGRGADRIKALVQMCPQSMKQCEIASDKNTNRLRLGE